MLSLVYMGPTDIISIKKGANFVSAEMRNNCKAAGVVLREAPIETAGSIRTVERNHAPLCLAFERIRMGSGREKSDGECVKIVVSVSIQPAARKVCA